MMEKHENGDVESREESSPAEISRRKLLRTAAFGTSALSLSSVLGGLGMAGTAEAAGLGKHLNANPYPAHPGWRFVFVNHVTTNPFFVPTQYGIQDAAALTNTSYQWTGSERSSVAEMVNAMNAAIASRAAGIAVAIIDPHAFNDPVARALARGIPVVAYNADAPASSGNQRMAYIGQDLFQSGVQMGKRIVNLVGRGDVVLFIATPGSLNIQPRIDGAASSIRAAGGRVHFQEIATGALVTEELARIEAYYLGHRSIKGMFAVDGGSTQSVDQIMSKYGLQARGVRAGGYDLTPVTLSSIARGGLNFTIDQQPYLQGFVPMMQLFLYKLSGGLMAPSNTNTGLKFVNRASVGKYLRTTSRYEGSSPMEKWIR